MHVRKGSVSIRKRNKLIFKLASSAVTAKDMVFSILVPDFLLFHIESSLKLVYNAICLANSTPAIFASDCPSSAIIPPD